MEKKTKILLIFSDTGGGHRSAAEAIIESLKIQYGDTVETEMVDFFKACPYPFNKQPEFYSYWVKIPEAWGMTFKLSNGKRRYQLIHAGLHPYVQSSIKKIIKNNPADIFVSVHPLANAAFLKELGKDRPPYITVVTDLITTHAGWFHYKPDLCIVPTEGAYAKALENDCDETKVKWIGQPIADKFCHDLGDKSELKIKLGWPVDKKMVLLVGGGEGMGPLEETAHAIEASGLDVGLAVICGKNEGLKLKLENQNWKMPIMVYGFVNNMAELMAASDVLVTKAGPGTIIEGVTAHLPILLYSRIPGQEEGNVDFVIDNELGEWTPEPDKMVEVLNGWLEKPEEYKRIQDNCKAMARPTATREIAREIMKFSKVSA